MSVDATKSPVGREPGDRQRRRGVEHVEACSSTGSSNRNTIPAASPRSVTPINPRPRSSEVSASQRHTSQTSPSAAMIRASIVVKPSGCDPEPRRCRGPASTCRRLGRAVDSPPTGRSTRHDAATQRTTQRPPNTTPSSARHHDDRSDDPTDVRLRAPTDGDHPQEVVPATLDAGLDDVRAQFLGSGR